MRMWKERARITKEAGFLGEATHDRRNLLEMQACRAARGVEDPSAKQDIDERARLEVGDPIIREHEKMASSQLLQV